MPPEDRTPNWSEDSLCDWCLNTALVTVSGEVHEGGDGTAQAPCPYCERGWRVEYAIGVRKDSRDKVVDSEHGNPRGGPWGLDGYWRGRTSAIELPRRVESYEKPAWIDRWRRARLAHDFRPFPEQLSALDEPPQKPIDEREAWVQPDEYLEDAAAPVSLDPLLGELLASL